MAHFAQIDENGVVLQVIVVNDADTVDENKVEQESIGVAFCASLLGGIWVQTSYNANFRKRFASIGDRYDATRDAFIPPQPAPSWVLNEASLTWDPPVAYPSDGYKYTWNEDQLNWIKL
jgi:hypothetical protein